MDQIPGRRIWRLILRIAIWRAFQAENGWNAAPVLGFAYFIVVIDSTAQ